MEIISSISGIAFGCGLCLTFDAKHHLHGTVLNYILLLAGGVVFFGSMLTLSESFN